MNGVSEVLVNKLVGSSSYHKSEEKIKQKDYLRVQNDFSKIRKEIKDSDARVNALLDRIKTAEKIKRKEGGRYGGSIRKNMDRAVENINLYSKILAKLTTDISRVQEVMENLLNRQSDKVSYVNKSLKKVTS